MCPNFNDIADDFFVNLNLQTTLALPTNRETVLQFCETVQKQYATMTALFQRESGEYVLEGDREAGSYQWLELFTHRLTAGFVNPPQLTDAVEFHRWLLERCRYFLGVAGLDVECLDLTYGFHLGFVGNRDAVIADALLGNCPLAAISHEGLGNVTECEPSIVFALDADCCVQARLAIETRCNDYQIRTAQYTDEPISVYLSVRRNPMPGLVIDPEAALADVARAGAEITERFVVPQVITPIQTAIATR